MHWRVRSLWLPGLRTTNASTPHSWFLVEWNIALGFEDQRNESLSQALSNMRLPLAYILHGACRGSLLATRFQYKRLRR